MAGQGSAGCHPASTKAEQIAALVYASFCGTVRSLFHPILHPSLRTRPSDAQTYLDALAGPPSRLLPDCCLSPSQKSLNSLRHLPIRRLGITATRIFHANPLWLDVPHSQASLPAPWLERSFLFFHLFSPNFDQQSSQRLCPSM